MSSRISYNQKSFKEIYGDRFVTSFNHGPYANGEICHETVYQVIGVLNKNPNKENVFFDNEKKETQLTGGACSAIALRIAKVALNSINIGLEGKLTQEVSEIDKNGRRRSKTSKIFREVIRSEQAAYNTITVNKSDSVNQIAQEKIRALAFYHQMDVSHSSKKLVASDQLDKMEFDEEVTKLEEGVYLMRVLKFENNHKLEKHGHSTLYIKTPDANFFFDPQIGLYQWSPSEKVDLIFQSIMSAKERFEIDEIIFHQLCLQTES